MDKSTQGTITVAPIETKYAKKAQDTALDLLKTSQLSVIKNQDSYEAAGIVLKTIKTHIKEVTAEEKKITNPLNLAKKAIKDLFRTPLSKLAEAESIVKRNMIKYTNEQEQIRRDQEEKLRKQAAAEETRKKKALKEQARKQEEKAIELRRQAEDADAVNKAALQAEAEAAEEKAEERRDKAEDVKVEAPVLAPRTEKLAGQSFRMVYTAHVFDFAILPDSYKIANMSTLNKVAQATKGTVPIPGVEFKSEKKIASRSF